MTSKRLFEHFSASQLSMYSECPRKWYNNYILGMKQPSTLAQLFGTTLHSVAEHYLRFGEVSLDMVHVPDGIDGDRVVDVFRAGVPHLPEPPIADVETEINIQASVPGIGYIDALYRDNGQLVILDHKTAKNTKYIPSPEELKDNIQLNVYGHWAIENYGEDTYIFKHLYYVHGLKKPKSVEVSVEVSADEIEANWSVYENIVSKMVVTSKLDEKEVPQNWSACQNYGGCPFSGKCHLTPYGANNMSKKDTRLIDTLLESKTSEKPKPIAINPPSPSPALPVVKEALPQVIKHHPPVARRRLFIKCLPTKGPDGSLSFLNYSDLIKPYTDSLCKQYDVPHISLIGQYGDGYKKLAAMIAHVGWPEDQQTIFINPIRSKGSELILDMLIACADEVNEGI
jgi:hypothetical protein|tara:strand:- start:722 stop:1915 length:1194 start_codon:yes stop_codon:yes gene_type:complete